MKINKRMATIAIGLTLALSTAGVAMADVTADQLQAIKDWHQQRVEQRAETLQTYVDAGKITAEQKQAALDRMEQNFAAREATGFAGCRAIQSDGTFQPGQGMGAGQGAGKGMGQGNGQGRGGMRGAGACLGLGVNQ